MKLFRVVFVLILLITGINSIPAQNITSDKGVYIDSKSEFYEEIQKAVDDFNSEPKKEEKSYKLDFSNFDIPKSVSEFSGIWHNDQVSQGLTGTCWAFAGTSFFESEIYRNSNEKIKLSEMFTVYWEYIEKARFFVQQRGRSNFLQGSEGNAVVRIWKKYGVVPLEAYSGKLPGQKFHDHNKMFKEMSEYLKHIKSSNDWNESLVVNTIRSILDHYMGRPPYNVTIDNEIYTPKEYFRKIVKLNMDDYIDIISVLKQPYYRQIEYLTDDNWWHCKDYCNVTLNEYYEGMKNAVKNGYTVCISGDVSEPGIDSHSKAGVIPSFDIPHQYINEFAREFRLNNKTTADDHVIHLVGYANKNNNDWFLIKDSGSGSKNKEPKGYYFFNEDYMKLKIIEYMVHKDAVKNILEKFNKK